MNINTKKIKTFDIMFYPAIDYNIDNPDITFYNLYREMIYHNATNNIEQFFENLIKSLRVAYKEIDIKLSVTEVAGDVVHTAPYKVILGIHGYFDDIDDEVANKVNLEIINYASFLLNEKGNGVMVMDHLIFYKDIFKVDIRFGSSELHNIN